MIHGPYNIKYQVCESCCTAHILQDDTRFLQYQVHYINSYVSGGQKLSGSSNHNPAKKDGVCANTETDRCDPAK